MPKHPNSPTHTMNRRPSDRRTLSPLCLLSFSSENVKERPSSERVSQSNNNRWNIFFPVLTWLLCDEKEKSRDGVWKTRRSVEIKEFFSLSLSLTLYPQNIDRIVGVLFIPKWWRNERSEWVRERNYSNTSSSTYIRSRLTLLVVAVDVVVYVENEWSRQKKTN